MYIAIEGLKGTGKSTLMRQLPLRLRAAGVPVVTLCPTRPLPFPHPLEQLAATGHDDALREQLYAARSNFHAARVPADAPLVLGDRSILTSYATRWDRLPAHHRTEHIAQVDALEHRIGRPDHVIYLSLPAPQLLARLRARIERRYGLDDQTPERLRSAARAYRDMREQAHSLGLDAITWHDLDARVTPEALLRAAERLIMRILQGAPSQTSTESSRSRARRHDTDTGCLPGEPIFHTQPRCEHRP